MINHDVLYRAGLLFDVLCDDIYFANVQKGWYSNPQTGKPIDRNPMEMLMLIVTEVSEAAEGWRKDLMDTHLPHHPMMVVEGADVLVRLFDLFGYIRNNPQKFPFYQGLSLGEAFSSKIIYNGNREDHMLHNRAKPEGKKC